MPSLLRVLAVVLFLAWPAHAREIADAPHARPIGFSEDGRYFAYEQYLNDALSGSVLASIDVIDRQGGRSADGFPVGYLGLSKDGQYPLKVGDHAVEVDESLPDEKRLPDFRRRLRAHAAAKLDALGIRTDARRLAGSPLTDRSRKPGPTVFVLGASIPGPVPDQQPSYRLTAAVAPADSAACIAGKAKPRDHTVELVVTQVEARATKPSRTLASIPWRHGDDECAQTIYVTDILTPEHAQADGASHVAVLVLVVAWAPHAEASRYLATFVALP